MLCNSNCVIVYLKTSWFSRFFFFQAEDGIRDYKVTGVQTCALPISHCSRIASRARSRDAATTSSIAWPRSEERRVGKEWSSRCPSDKRKKKKIETAKPAHT